MGKAPVSAATTISNVTAQAVSLSPQAQISLLTSSPSDDYVYTLYGHTALRVYDPEARIDLVYNYGIFDFSKPNFIYRFAKGETDYILAAYDFRYYIEEYIERGSEVCEQVLNLLPEEKESLWQALELNRRPENRVYRYNFFFDNCATRPVVMIENSISGTIEYAYQKGGAIPTFRDAINNCTRNHPWVTFGCDLVLGMPTDHIMTFEETFFLPHYLKDAFDKAEIVRSDSAPEPLIKETKILSYKADAADPESSFLSSPFFCFIMLFAFLSVLTVIELKGKRYYRLVDCILFFAAGMAGCVMFFLNFMSVHPSMFPNISLLWLHPFHLIGVIFFSVKTFNKMAFWYHFINFAAIFGMSVVWFFVPQHFNIAFFPLIAAFLLRSGGALIRKYLS